MTTAYVPRYHQGLQREQPWRKLINLSVGNAFRINYLKLDA